MYTYIKIMKTLTVLPVPDPNQILHFQLVGSVSKMCQVIFDVCQEKVRNEWWTMTVQLPKYTFNQVHLFIYDYFVHLYLYIYLQYVAHSDCFNNNGFKQMIYDACINDCP